MKNNIGINLKELLRKENMNESELSKKTGVSQQVINRMVTGINTNPKLETLMPIAQYFNIPLQDLITREGLKENIKVELITKQVPFVTFKEMKQLGLDNAVTDAKKFISVDIDTTEDKYYFATSMYDDSMEPKFPKGTILVFEKTSQVFSGDFCLLNGEDNNYVFRQIMINGSNKKFTKGLNPDYEEYSPLPLSINYYVLATLLEARMVFSS